MTKKKNKSLRILLPVLLIVALVAAGLDLVDGPQLPGFYIL